MEAREVSPVGEFSLDTSGGVFNVPGAGIAGECWWSDLSPFVQGYVTAMARGLCERLPGLTRGRTALEAVAFSNWAPTTLAAILRDCEAFTSQLQDDYTDERLAMLGRDFWRCRNDRQSMTGFPSFGGWASLSRRARAFPPLTPYLGKGGKVHLKEARI